MCAFCCCSLQFLSSWCLVTVSVLCFFLTVQCVGLQCVILVFPDYSHLPCVLLFFFLQHICFFIVLRAGLWSWIVVLSRHANLFLCGEGVLKKQSTIKTIHTINLFIYNSHYNLLLSNKTCKCTWITFFSFLRTNMAHVNFSTDVSKQAEQLTMSEAIGNYICNCIVFWSLQNQASKKVFAAELFFMSLRGLLHFACLLR